MFVKLLSRGPDKYGTWSVSATHVETSFCGEGPTEQDAADAACDGIARVCGIPRDEVVVFGGMSRLDRKPCYA